MFNSIVLESIPAGRYATKKKKVQKFPFLSHGWAFRQKCQHEITIEQQKPYSRIYRPLAPKPNSINLKYPATV